MGKIVEKLRVTGALKITLRDEHGNIKKELSLKNLVVSAGLAFIASRMKDATATAMSHMALGTGAVAPVAGNTTLGAEAGRVALTSTTVTTNQVAYAATFGAGVATGAITEAGILNAAAAGTLLARTTFSVVNKAAGDTLTITWTVTLS